MHKRNLLLTALMGAVMIMGPSGCGGGDEDENTIPVVITQMAATFAPSGGEIPVPNDLLFSESADLTLNIPVVDPDDYSNPLVAINGLDGWSAVAPFSVSFKDFGSGLTLDPDSVVGGSSVRVYKVNTNRPDIAEGISAPTGPVTSVERELVAGTEYIVLATSGTSIAIIPTVPFVQQAGYMVVLTNDLLDSNGNPVTTDLEYEASKSPVAISSTSSLAALEPVRQLIYAMESAAEADGVVRSDIILSFQFTVQSVGTVMNTAKTAYIDYPISLGATPVMSFSPTGMTTAPFTGIGAADIYVGSVLLNYMLGIPSVDNPIAPLNTFWTATTPTGDPSPLGSNLSYANPLPLVTGTETVPLLVSLPNSEGCQKPEAGYPVAIFQHGITGNRTNAIGIMDALALPPTCTAVVSMDQPIHGIVDEGNPFFTSNTAGGLRERTFGMDYVNNTTGAAGSDGQTDSSGAHTINLANLQVARDNLRQAIFDLLYLEKAVPFMNVVGDGADFDSSKISFIGHSLGGMVGTGLLAYSDNINAAALANPGGGIAELLNASLAFGPVVRAGLSAGSGIAQDDSAFPGYLAQFLFATQTVVDAGDPINTAAHALTNAVPTLLLQVLNDSTVPNAVATAPLSGTEPLGNVLELTTVATTSAGLVTGSRLFSKLNQGHHGTVLSPDDGLGNPIGLLNVTTEMQTQIASFLATVGTATLVTDPSLLDD